MQREGVKTQPIEMPEESNYIRFFRESCGKRLKEGVKI
jgi:hypothetical protein